MDNHSHRILQDALLYDIIPTETLESIEKMTKKQKVDSVHCYSITKVSGKECRFQTYLKTNTGRKKISAYSEEDLYNKLYKYYFIDDLPTPYSFYEDWLVLKQESNLSPRTILRYKQIWNRYYKNNSFVTIPFEKMTPDNIESFLLSCIKAFKLNTKGYNNMKFIISDMLRYAKRKKWILTNPMDEIIIKPCSCEATHKTPDSDRIYFPEEKEALFNEIHKELNNYPDNTDSYAIMLLFKTGLRIGEIVALKWCDIDFVQRQIHVHRIESVLPTEKSTSTPVILDHTKKKSSSGERFIPFGDYEEDIFQKIKYINEKYHYSDNDFIFCDSEGRTTIRQIDNRLRKLCNHAGIKEKSAHDIRRTVASELHANGVPVIVIQKFLGHSDVSTTWGYIYNNKSQEETNSLIVNSLLSLNCL